MGEQTILTKAIKKAVDHGFDLTLVGGFYTLGQMKTKDFKWEVKKLDKGLATIWSYDLCITCEWTSYENKQISSNISESSYRHMNFTTEQVIFNHDFAKSLWGEEYPKLVIEQATANIAERDTYRLGAMMPYWQSQLQMMVIQDDPIKYLGEHIDG